MENSSPQPRLGSEPERRPKRRKVAVACDECRARKIRCDGTQPGTCSVNVATSDRSNPHCLWSMYEAIGYPVCLYRRAGEKKSRAYIASLENRIKHLESPGYSPTNGGSDSRLRTSGHAQVAITLSRDPHLRSIYAIAKFTSRTRGEEQCLCRHWPPVAIVRSPERPSEAEERDDGVNAMMGALEEERQSQGFFGSSSAASFMRQIKTAVDKRVASPHRQTSESIMGALPRSSLMSARVERPSVVSNYVLPPRKTADSLMDVYWCFVFPLYPLVDSILLRREYSKIWTGETLESDENMLMCTLNVIFALACQLADFIPPEEREASADAFFSRAKDLLHFNLWHSGSAGLIQCLLLMAQYLQSTDSAHQCWIVTGLAIRNAQSLGLHLPQTIARLPSFQEQQLARKIWHGCVLMDRVISMTFGRPAMISKASCGSVPLPATVDEEYIPAAVGDEATQPADRPSVMAFYAKSLELYEILNDILLSLYKPVPEENPEDIYDFYFNKETSQGERTIFELDRALTKWTRSLPPHLRGELPSRPENAVFYHQSVVLKARFLHVRMLLFRPILSKFCTARDITPLDPLISLDYSFPQRVALQCSVICVKVAQEVIELIHSNIPADGTMGPLPAWWYNILSATVLIAGRLRSAILEEVTGETITRSWDCALEILRKYHSYSTSARRCVAALEILYERVASEEQPQSDLHNNQPTASSALNDMSLGEGMNALMLDGLDLPDFQDMSWLNSVPSNLY
ncbi:transcription factor domain-containing protein [Aspergillus clavatus NRRL 1]|uniref:Fungal specific transcription factor domain protein n=1 Tax=Aspergillus clavatus (strain ATCC 1007 / CBS 513.65 / DSM 816 / NCTC 3887 / NRRL 1 / QM 1276 / 107) TaxID=344612 RepID=A1CNA5_ASPCL|nr:fungal specific transcription factor domain protein [Aspergillus clavatus NRRL 1]EAW07126.1 fungal specific transcription factor domain protein [Aspergillus clavatus NRRL 1]